MRGFRSRSSPIFTRCGPHAYLGVCFFYRLNRYGDYFPGATAIAKHQINKKNILSFVNPPAGVFSVRREILEK